MKQQLADSVAAAVISAMHAGAGNRLLKIEIEKLWTDVKAFNAERHMLCLPSPRALARVETQVGRQTVTVF